MNVIEDYKSHENIAKKLNAPNFGSDSIWNDFAKYGFYIYDFELHNGPYKQITIPEVKVPENLINDLSNLRSLVQLNLSFEDTKEISF